MVSGSGTALDPYILSSLADLEQIAVLGLNKWYKLGADIDASGTQDAGYNAGAGWSPIGTFTGYFDGNNKTISGLYINRGTTDNVGFFSQVNGGSFKDLTLSNVDITGQNNVGALIGTCDGNPYFSNIDISSGTVTGTANGVGGLIGYGYYLVTLIDVNINTSLISGVNNVGGLIGTDRDYLATIQDCNVSSDITGSGNYIGGMLGYYRRATFKGTNSYSGDVTGLGYVGGIAGGWGNATNFKYNSSAIITVSGTATGTTCIGGFIGGIFYGGTIEGLTNENMIINCPTADGVGGIVGWHSITSNYDLTITNCHNETEINGRDYTSGIIGGCNSITRITNCDNIGEINGRNYVGGLVGICNSNTILTTSYGESDIIGSSGTGGLVGGSALAGGAYVVFDRCWYSGTVTGTDHVGGIYGLSGGYSESSDIKYCYSKGKVVSSDSYAGGIVGYSRTQLNNCFSTMEIEGNNYVAGLVGFEEMRAITNCYSNGAVSGVSNLGGLVAGSSSGGSATNSYWDTVTSGRANSNLGTGKTTAQLQAQATFSGWNFDTIWVQDTNLNNGCPVLLKVPFDGGLETENVLYKLIPITGSSDGAKSDYNMKLLNIKYMNGMQLDFSDLDFRNLNDSMLPFWITEKLDGVYAKVYVLVDDIPASPDTVDIKLYYNTGGTVSLSNGDDTFPFFDNFPGSSLNGDKWTDNANITKTINNYFEITDTGVNKWVYNYNNTDFYLLEPKYDLPSKYEIGFKMNIRDDTSNDKMGEFLLTLLYNSNHNVLLGMWDDHSNAISPEQQFYTGADGTETNVVGVSDVTHDFKLKYDGTNVKAYFDEILKKTTTLVDAINNWGFVASKYQNYPFPPIQLKDVYVREITANEPVWGVFGLETEIPSDDEPIIPLFGKGKGRGWDSESKGWI